MQNLISTFEFVANKVVEYIFVKVEQDSCGKIIECFFFFL